MYSVSDRIFGMTERQMCNRNKRNIQQEKFQL